MSLEPRSPFNEQAALAELERLQSAIQTTRRKRQQAMAEFQAFLTETRQSPALPPRAEAPALVVERQPASEPVRAEAASAAARAETIAPERRRSRLAIAAALAGVILATLAGIALWPSGQAPAPAGPVTTPGTRPAAEAAAPAPTPTPPVPAAAPAEPDAPLRITLTTSRPVWLRVMADGRRRLEREVPAGERLTFSAERGIVVRTGDAGGVTLTVNGVDQGVLGRNYAIATKAIEIP